MLNVPRKANDAMHLSLLDGCDSSIDKLGEVILQDSFQVWDPKQIIRKARERHIFLFELFLLFSKEVKDSSGKVKYIYKNKLMVSYSVLNKFRIYLYSISTSSTDYERRILTYKTNILLLRYRPLS